MNIKLSMQGSILQDNTIIVLKFVIWKVIKEGMRMEWI